MPQWKSDELGQSVRPVSSEIYKGSFRSRELKRITIRSIERPQIQVAGRLHPGAHYCCGATEVAAEYCAAERASAVFPDRKVVLRLAAEARVIL